MNKLRRSLISLSTLPLLSLGAYGAIAMAATPILMGAQLLGSSEAPAVMTNATGTLEASFAPESNLLMWKITYTGLSGPVTGAHFHGPAMIGQNAGVAVPINGPLISPMSGSAILTTSQAADLTAGKLYVNLHTAAYPNGEIRGQVNVRP